MGLAVYYHHHENHTSVSPTEDLLKLPGLFEPQVPLLSLLIAHSCQQHLSDPPVSLEPALVGSHRLVTATKALSTTLGFSFKVAPSSLRIDESTVCRKGNLRYSLIQCTQEG